jgi:primosomal protein N' (replication factor Y) (superfamily II helicase)
MIFLEVAVTLPLEQTLTYTASPQLFAADGVAEAQSVIGRRVLVPLGNRRVTGYVVGLAEQMTPDVARLKEIVQCLDEQPLFPENLVSFYRWAAEYYQYPLGLVVKSALPAGLSGSARKRVLWKGQGLDVTRLFPQGFPPWVSELIGKGRLGYQASKCLLADKEQRRLLDMLVSEGGAELVVDRPRDGAGERYLHSYDLCDKGRDLAQLLTVKGEEENGHLLAAQRRAAKLAGHDLTAGELRLLLAIAATSEKSLPSLAQLKELCGAAAGKGLAALVVKGLVSEHRQRLYRTPFGAPMPFYPRPSHFSEGQQRVLKEILPQLGNDNFFPVLLHGVTGCGKTEVYLQAAEKTLQEGRDVLVLVPEIALATQLESHFLSRFGELVVLLHSGLTTAERFDQYGLALSGQARIVIGARSAVFAPLRRLGLIIVDEEHDPGFKQDEGFCYHGRDLAVLRASLQRCTVILGSATPSITSYAHGKSGKYRLLSMQERVFDRSLPKVAVVDLRRQENKVSQGLISPPLLDRLHDTLARGKQAILLINRRGFAAASLCRDCGTPVQCNHCHVSLTWHKGRNRLICHYCGFSLTTATLCDNCRGSDLAPAGFGTERVEDEIRQLLPGARLARLDSDSALDRRGFFATLAAMHQGEIDILIGTQMIAKGHHFPGVTLVGVVLADGGMSMPDFRAAERTFQLLTQVTGRAGRGDTPGEVIIQTLRPDHYSIVYATRHDYEGMFDHELRLRKHPRFPPFVRLAVVRVKGRVERMVQESCAAMARFLRQRVAAEKLAVEILGPAPAPLDKIRDNYRWQLLLKTGDSESLKALGNALRTSRATLLSAGCEFIVDVDPENMM